MASERPHQSSAEKQGSVQTLPESRWLDFLRNAGAAIADDTSIRFADPASEARAIREGNICCPVNSHRWISVSGADAEKFLQSQLTSDVRSLKHDCWQAGAYCDPKGRVLAVFQLVRCDDSIWLMTPRELAESIVKRLRLYVLRAKVSIGVLEDLVNIGIAGRSAPDLARECWSAIPDHANAVIRDQDGLIRRLPGPEPRILWTGPAELAPDLWDRLRRRCRAVGEGPWARLDIVSGWPRIGASSSGEFIPQALGLERLAAVSFTKGCYPGQEIVARVHYLGHAKQTAVLSHVRCDSPPAPKSPFFRQGERVGTILDSQLSPEGGYDVLAVVPTTATGVLRVGAADGPEAHQREFVSGTTW